MNQPKEKTAEFTAQDFSKAYEEICLKFGYNIVAVPVWTNRDDGTFSLVIQYHIGQLPKKPTVS